jgi:hypothetical protein
MTSRHQPFLGRKSALIIDSAFKENALIVPKVLLTGRMSDELQICLRFQALKRVLLGVLHIWADADNM